MRGSSKILMAFFAVMILAAPLARAGGDLGLPTDETSKGTTIQLVGFDGVFYRVVTEVPCELYFRRVDDSLHRLDINIKPVEDELTPVCIVVVQWGGFPPVSLGLEAGGTNSWLLGTETGYAEK